MAVITIDMSRDTQIREKARLREKALHDEVFYKGAEAVNEFHNRENLI